MGNQQALVNNYYSAENDSDSGFGELSSSPFEFNNNTTFDYLYEQDRKLKHTKSSPNKPILNDDEFETNTPTKIPKSKSFGIRIMRKPDSFDFDENINETNVNNSKPPLISVSFDFS